MIDPSSKDGSNKVYEEVLETYDSTLSTVSEMYKGATLDWPTQNDCSTSTFDLVNSRLEETIATNINLFYSKAILAGVIYEDFVLSDQLVKWYFLKVWHWCIYFSRGEIFVGTFSYSFATILSTASACLSELMCYRTVGTCSCSFAIILSAASVCLSWLIRGSISCLHVCDLTVPIFRLLLVLFV